MNKFKFLKNELLIINYSLISNVKENEFFTIKVVSHKLNNKKKFLAKIYNKKDIFFYESFKNFVNRELYFSQKCKNLSQNLLNFIEYYYSQNYLIIIYEYPDKGNLLDYYNYIVKNKKYTSLKFWLVLIKDFLIAIKKLKKIGVIISYIDMSWIYIVNSQFKLGGYEFFRNRTFNKIKECEINFLKNLNINYNFIAPEVLENKNINFKTSLFSFNIIIYNLLEKKTPFFLNKYNQLIKDSKILNWNFIFKILKLSNLNDQTINSRKRQIIYDNSQIFDNKIIETIAKLILNSLCLNIDNRISMFEFNYNFKNLIKPINFMINEIKIRQNLNIYYNNINKKTIISKNSININNFVINKTIKSKYFNSKRLKERNSRHQIFTKTQHCNNFLIKTSSNWKFKINIKKNIN